MGQILYEAAPLPSQIHAGVSPALDDLCKRAMAREPQARFPSMLAFADAAGNVLRSYPTKASAGSFTDRETAPVFKAPTVPAKDPDAQPTIRPDSGWGVRPSEPPRALPPISRPPAAVPPAPVPSVSSRKPSSRVRFRLPLLAGVGLVVAVLLLFALKPRIPKSFTNDVGMTMVGIPAGTFQMGSPKEETDRHKDEKDHEVSVSAFYLGAHEVTQKQFRTVMGWNPSWFSKNASGRKDTVYLLKPGGGADKVPQSDDTENYPVENVSWDEAKEFCDKLTALDTKKPAGWKYRLPTEAEWEYACRGGVPSYQVFHFGDTLSARQANFDGSDPYGNTDKIDPLNRTCTAGSYEKNAFGLYDMHGNVREWCADWYYYRYYWESPPEDPPGMAEGTYRVVRGGGWSFCGGICRSAYRSRAEPTSRGNDRGFRAALVKAK